MILAGDIGGTKTYLGLFQMVEGKVRPMTEIKEYSSRSYPSFTALVQDFLVFLDQSSLREDEKFIGVTCFGIAGPIKTNHNGRRYCEMTNIPQWPVITEVGLSQLINCEKVILLNDLEAIGYGISPLSETMDNSISPLSEADLVELNPGTPQKGNRAVIAAGTGLGQLMLYWDGHEHIPSASEGGHTDFAARDQFEYALQNYLREKCYPKQVNYEQVLSGRGLVNIYEFLRDCGEYGKESADLKERFGKQDKAQVISEAALRNKNTLCIKALDVFISIYGAQARNLALQCLPLNGLYIGGGIAPKILAKLRETTFMHSFVNENGEFPDLLASIPVKVIMNPQVGLLGAALRGAKI